MSGFNSSRKHRFERYDEASEQARRALASAQGLSALHRSMLVAALRNCTEHCEDRLTALRAFWTWQRYTSALYAKQSYTPTGKGIAINPPRQPGARIQLSLDVYLGLARVVEGHRKFTPHPSWDAFAEILDRVIEGGGATRLAVGGRRGIFERFGCRSQGSHGCLGCTHHCGCAYQSRPWRGAVRSHRVGARCGRREPSVVSGGESSGRSPQPMRVSSVPSAVGSPMPIGETDWRTRAAKTWLACAPAPTKTR